MTESKKSTKTNPKSRKHNSPNQTDNVGGRPSKLENFLVGMERVLNKDINSIILTDEELFISANAELPEEDRIGYTTFKQYKASSIKEEKAWHSKFQSLYKEALGEQKKNLFNKLHDDPQAWQRYAWIIERKFSEWNLRQISENTNKNHTIEYSKEEWDNMSDDELDKIISD